MPTQKLFVFYCILFLSIITGCARQSFNELTVEVMFNKEISTEQIPITIDIPEEYGILFELWEVKTLDSDTNNILYAQTWQSPVNKNHDKGAHHKISFIWEPKQTIFPSKVQFSLKAINKSPEKLFKFEDDSNTGIKLYESDKSVLNYNYGMILKTGVPEDRRRSSYIHPVYGLDDEILTDDFPKDHYHHRGIFWAWPHVIIDSVSNSLWDLKGIRHQFENWLGKEVGPVFARFGVSNGWYIDTKKVMQEIVWVTLFRAGSSARIMDFNFTWEPIDKPITLLGAENKGYGGFNLRFAPFKDPVITTRDGIHEKDSDRLRFPWADLSAKFSQAQTYSGVAIFEHNGNINTPNTWTLRHYGFLNPSWPSLETYTVKPEEVISLHYRVLIHRGNAQEGKVQESYSLYANPPEVRIIDKKQ